MSEKTFADRCKIAQDGLPDAPYRAMLSALHNEMLQAHTSVHVSRYRLLTAVRHFLSVSVGHLPDWLLQPAQAMRDATEIDTRPQPAAREPLTGYIKKIESLIFERNALRQLLEQPEQDDKPVAWMHVDAYQPSNRHLEWKEICKGYRGDWIKHPLYTRPQPAAWVDLTDEDWKEIYLTTDAHTYGRAIEAKLREKNTSQKDTP